MGNDSHDSPDGSTSGSNIPLIRIPNCILLRRIGSGSSGEVWLAREEVTGRYQAVKLIFRDNFTNERPYLRELRGIKKYAPISDSHPGFVRITSVAEEVDRGCFYYAMELADDVHASDVFDPNKYEARAVDNHIREGCRFDVDQVLELGLRLSDAIQHLHDSGLVHRDIKPANLLYVSGRPKLADIGLVTDEVDASSLVGTPGYIPPEGAGSRQADVFALGKVLYECLTGLDRTQFPSLPSFLESHPDHGRFLELNEIVLKACHHNPSNRYRTARELHAELTAVENGKSVVRLRQLELKVGQFKRLFGIAAGVLVVAVLAVLFVQREVRNRDRDKQRTIGALVGQIAGHTEAGDYARALQDIASLVSLGSSPRMDRINRLRFGTTFEQMPKLTLLQAMGGPARWCEFTDHDRAFLIAMADGRCQMRDATSGIVLREFVGHTNAISVVTASADQSTLFTAGDDGTVRVWETATGRLIRTMEHPKVVLSLAVDGNSRFIASGSVDGVVRIWDGKTGALKKEFSAHPQAITALAYNHSGTLLASGGRDSAMRMWSTDSGEPVGRPFKHAGWVVSLDFSPDDRQIVTACSDHSAYVWAVEGGGLSLPPLRHERGVAFVHFSPDGGYIVTSGWDNLVCLWDSATGENLNPILRHSSPLRCAKFSSKGDRLVTSCADGSIRIWDLAGRRVPQFLNAHNVNADGTSFLRIRDKSEVEIYSLKITDQPRVRIDAGTPISRAFLNTDGKYVATVATIPKPSIRLWRVADARPCTDAIPLSNGSTRVYFDVAGHHFAVVDHNLLNVRRIADGNLACPPIVKDNRIDALGFSPDASSVAVGSSYEVDVRDTSTARSLFPPLQHQKRVKSVLFSPDSKLIVTCTSDSSVGESCYSQVWDAQTGRSVGPQLWHGDGILGAAWNSEGRELITYGEDGHARIWTVPTGLPKEKELSHRNQIIHATINWQSGLAITGSEDQTIRIWDTEGGDPVGPYFHLPGRLRRTWLGSDLSICLAQDTSGAHWVQNLTTVAADSQQLRDLSNILAGRSDLKGNADDFASARDIAVRWSRLRADFPDWFSVSASERVAWLRIRIEQFKRAKQPAGEKFFTEKLLQLQPNENR